MVISTAGSGVKANPSSAPVAPGQPTDGELALRQKSLEQQVKALNEQAAEEESRPQMLVSGKDYTSEQTLREVGSALVRGPTIANPNSQPRIDSAKLKAETYHDEPVSEEELASRISASTGVQTYHAPELDQDVPTGHVPDKAMEVNPPDPPASDAQRQGATPTSAKPGLGVTTGAVQSQPASKK